MRELVIVAWVVVLSGSVATSAGAQAPPDVAFLETRWGKVRIFPADNPWNQDVSRLPVHPRSADYVATIGADKPLKADFGTEWEGAPIGIPYCVVGRAQPKSKVRFQYADESDAGPYPIPDDPPIEGGPASTGDRHVLIVAPEEGRIYELYSTNKKEDGWHAGSGAIWDVTTNKLRQLTWTSADAAGLPIFPGLARYDEAVERGVIPHALRFTCRRTQQAFILPATHQAGESNDPTLPPMGLRMRLKANIDPGDFPKHARPVVVALQKYGMILADNGSDWFVSGAPHPKWSDEQLRSLSKIKGSDFEAVDTGKIIPKR